MAKGGIRKGAGRPKGSRTRPQIHDFVTPEQTKKFVAYVLGAYKKKPELAKWLGDQLFGKAIQPLGNDNGKPLLISFDNAFARTSETDSEQ